MALAGRAGDDRDRGVAAAEQAGCRVGRQRRLPRARRCARDRRPRKPDERRLPRRDGRLDRKPPGRRRREGHAGRSPPPSRSASSWGRRAISSCCHAQAAFLHGFTRGLIGGAALLLLGALFVAVRAPGRAESRSNATGKPARGRRGGERLSEVPTRACRQAANRAASCAGLMLPPLSDQRDPLAAQAVSELQRRRERRGAGRLDEVARVLDHQPVRLLGSRPR